jgi:hypothetical protein
MKMFGNSVNVQSELFNLTFYGFPSVPFIRLCGKKDCNCDSSCLHMCKWKQLDSPNGSV